MFGFILFSVKLPGCFSSLLNALPIIAVQLSCGKSLHAGFLKSVSVSTGILYSVVSIKARMAINW